MNINLQLDADKTELLRKLLAEYVSYSRYQLDSTWQYYANDMEKLLEWSDFNDLPVSFSIGLGGLADDFEYMAEVNAENHDREYTPIEIALIRELKETIRPYRNLPSVRAYGRELADEFDPPTISENDKDRWGKNLYRGYWAFGNDQHDADEKIFNRYITVDVWSLTPMEAQQTLKKWASRFLNCNETLSVALDGSDCSRIEKMESWELPKFETHGNTKLHLR